jgi:hypothetical protein
MSKNKKLSEENKNIIKQMYEAGISCTLIVSAMKKKYNVEVSQNSIRQWASMNKWKRGSGAELNETIDTLPISFKNEINKIDKVLKEEDDNSSREILDKMSNLFNYAYKELEYRLSNESIAKSLEVDDLIKVIKTATEALVELKKINKRTGNVYLQFNFDIDYESKNEEKLDEMIKNSQPKDNIILVETEFENKDDDPFNRLEKTRNINIIRKI